METVEILAGGEFANAVKSLGPTSAVCTYHYQPQPTLGLTMACAIKRKALTMECLGRK